MAGDVPRRIGMLFLRVIFRDLRLIRTRCRNDLRIPKQVATTNPNHTASRRLMERLGLSQVGLSGAYGGKSVLYEITREQFEGFAANA